MKRAIRVLLTTAFFSTLLSVAADSAIAAPRQHAITGSTATAALAGSVDTKHESTPGLGAFLDDDGHLNLPAGFSGSLDPRGFRIVSGEGEALRFVPGAANAGQADDRWAGTGVVGNGCNGPINAVAVEAGGQLIVGGFFTQCGTVAANFVARFDPSTQAWTSLGTGSANGVNSQVNAIVVAGGSVFVGGFFTEAGGATANRVARFDPVTQEWSSLGTGTANGVNDVVYAIAVADSRVVVGGFFTAAGGATANRVARFNTSTQTWSSLSSGAANGVNFWVYALAIAGSDIFVGGFFNEAGGVSVRNLARFNTANLTWSSVGIGPFNGVNGAVFTLAIAGSELYVGGSFNEAGFATVNRVARFNTNTQTWSSLGSGAANGANGTVSALAIAGSDVLVGGRFTQAGGATANFVARFNTTTQTWSSFGSDTVSGVGGGVRTLATTGSDVYVGGFFNQAGGATASNVARFNTTMETWSPLGSEAANGVNGYFTTLATTGSDFYVGGFFTQAGGATANFVARFNTAAQTWSALGSGAANGVNGAIDALVISGSDVYVGGSFTQAGGAPANYVARFNTSTQTWASLGSGAANGVSSQVRALAIVGSDVVVAGFFTMAGGAPANRVARFNTTTQTWSSLGSGAANGVNGEVRALAIAGSDIVIGGGFTLAGGAPANRVARFNTSSQTWSSLGSGAANGVGGEVRALAITGSDVYVGGDFSQAGGVTANYVARFNTNMHTWSSLGSGATNGVNSLVRALAIADGELHVGGAFTQAGGAPANRMARFNLAQQRWIPTGSAVSSGYVAALALTADGFAIGGNFGEAGGNITSTFALYRTGDPATVTVDAAPLPAVASQPVTVTTTVAGNLGPAAGEIRIAADSGESCTVSAPSGSCPITFTSEGSRTINALYLGDGDYEATASPGVEIRVGVVGEPFGNVVPLEAVNGSVGDQGGTSVAVGDGVVAMGAPNGGGTIGLGAGEVILFAPSSPGQAGEILDVLPAVTPKLVSNNLALQQVAVLRPPLGSQAGDRFGAVVSVARDGSRIAIGAPGAAGGEGRVYVFDRVGTAWSDSSAPARSLAPPLEIGVIPLGFGAAIDVGSDGTVVVGAADADRAGNTDSGAVYVYFGTGNAGAALPAPAGNATGDRWGSGVALETASRIATGAPGRDVDGRADQGAVDLYRIESGAPVFDRTLVATIGIAGERCGTAIDADGALIVAGCLGPGIGAGGGLAWQRNGLGTVTEVARLTVPVAIASSAAGQSVAVGGGLILLGAPDYDNPTAQARTGAVFAYQLAGTAAGGYVVPISTLAPANGAADDRYGASVALAGGLAVLGIPNRDVIGSGALVERQGRADAYGFTPLLVFANGFE